jgi:hypothetical protein
MTSMKTMLLALLAGALCTFVFAGVCWPLVDALVPVAGIHFWSVWQAHPTLAAFFEGLDACGLGAAFVTRLQIIACVSLFLFGPLSASRIYRALILRRADRNTVLFGPLLILTAFVSLAAIAATEFAVIHSPVANAGSCVVELRAQTPW